MGKKKEEPTMPIYMSLRKASDMTGLSYAYIRNRLRSGELPYVKSGTTFMINMQKFLELLSEEEANH